MFQYTVTVAGYLSVKGTNSDARALNDHLLVIIEYVQCVNGDAHGEGGHFIVETGRQPWNTRMELIPYTRRILYREKGCYCYLIYT